MSYKEYFDIYEKAQLKDCNYLAIFVDVVNSKTEIKDANDILTHYNFINKLTNNLEKYLKKDENNIVFYHFNNKNIDANSLNPISIGADTSPCAYIVTLPGPLNSLSASPFFICDLTPVTNVILESYSSLYLYLLWHQGNFAVSWYV